MIQILFGIWFHLLKQSCWEFYGEQFFFILQPLKRFVKASKVSFKLFGKINLKKEKEDRRCWADPPPFRPSQTAWPVSPPLSLPRASSWTRRGRPAYTWSGRRPAPLGHSILSPLLSLSSSSPRAVVAAAAAALRRAPLAPKPSSQLRSPALD